MMKFSMNIYTRKMKHHDLWLGLELSSCPEDVTWSGKVLAHAGYRLLPSSAFFMLSWLRFTLIVIVSIDSLNISFFKKS
jgi:hypothetical protein